MFLLLRKIHLLTLKILPMIAACQALHLMQTCYQTMMMTMNLEVTLKVFQVLLNYQTGYHGIQPWKL